MSQTALLQRAEKIFVGGSNGEFRLPPEANLVVSHGKGVTIYDISGKAYTDFLLGSGMAHCGCVSAGRRLFSSGGLHRYVYCHSS